MKEYKVVVLGSGGVGKSALTVQFVCNTFRERYDPTIEDFYRKQIEVDGFPCMLEILDTEGTEQFTSMRELYMKNGHGFLLIYSITHKQTLHDIMSMREQIVQIKGRENVPIILAGNKCDICNEREVSKEDGALLAQKWRCPFFETSAKTRYNVDNMFAEVVRKMPSINQKIEKKECCIII